MAEKHANQSTSNGNMPVYPRIDPSTYMAPPSYYQGRAAFTETRQPSAPVMDAPTHSIRNDVKLNIGGTVFQTSRATLTKFDGFFKSLLETTVPVPINEFGEIFIDRDPKHFRVILNYMRNGDVTAFPISKEDSLEVMKEAQFYMLTDLVTLFNVELEKMKRKEKIEEKLKNQAPAGEAVKLNIGGTIFHTTKWTLIKQRGLFKEIVKGKTATKIDHAGCIFIDRNPENFQFFLDYMQNGKAILSENRKELKKLYKDAEFYKFRKLSDDILTMRIGLFMERIGLF